MEVQNGSYQRFLGKLGTHTPLYDYTGIGGSEDFGLYYAVPYSDENDSVSGCIIYPVDEAVKSGASYKGTLGNPVNFNGSFAI
jgi:hypothetical protein